MTTRRDALRLGAWACASAALPAVRAADARPGTLLILGGTGFIGPPLTQEALQRGWKVTHFNRGKTAADGVAHVETLIGDRKGNLDALRGRKFDAVVDDTGYIPKYCKMSAELLAPSVGYCLFISSISAYASFVKPNDEHSATGTLKDPQAEEITDDSYGPMKALCEQYSRRGLQGTLQHRAARLHRGSRRSQRPLHLLAGARLQGRRDAGAGHGAGSDPDHRRARSGRLDDEARGEPHQRLLQCRLGSGRLHHGRPRERERAGLTASRNQGHLGAGGLSRRALEDRGAGPAALGAEQGRVLPAPPSPQPTRRARQACGCARWRRPCDDTLAWFKTLPAERQAKLRAGLDPQKEAETLRLWHADKLSG